MELHEDIFQYIYLFLENEEVSWPKMENCEDKMTSWRAFHNSPANFSSSRDSLFRSSRYNFIHLINWCRNL